MALGKDIYGNFAGRTKLYKVVLKDNEDGGHVLGEAIFVTAVMARSEFLRIRNEIFDGFWWDQPQDDDERCSWHADDHFTHYHNNDFDLQIVIDYTGKQINFFDKNPEEDWFKLVSLFNSPDDKYEFSIASLFEFATQEASSWCTLMDFRKGFKKIYNFVKPRLHNSFVRCEYSKGCETNPCQMDYFVIGKDGEDAVVTISEENGIYSYYITV